MNLRRGFFLWGGGGYRCESFALDVPLCVCVCVGVAIMARSIICGFGLTYTGLGHINGLIRPTRLLNGLGVSLKLDPFNPFI